MHKKIFILGVSLWAGIASAQIQQVGAQGFIDWEKRTVTAKGIGAPNPKMPAVTNRPMAIQAARSDALRNALEVMKGININASTTVENYMVSSDVINKEVSGFIRTYTESEPKYMSDKTIEITVTVPMDEKFNGALLPRNTGEYTAGTAPQPANAPAENLSSAENFTGLIIDARGLGIMPALAPRILDENGTEIYGTAQVSREFAVKWGMAGYGKDPESAAKNYQDRLGTKPGLIKAMRSSGKNRCDVVLSAKDAALVAEASRSMSFLRDCRVVILVD